MGPPGQEPVDSDLHLGCGGPTPFCAAWGRQLEAHPSVNERDAPPGTVLPAAVCMWPGLECVQDGRSPQAEPQTPSSQCACRGPARRKRAHPATGRAPLAQLWPGLRVAPWVHSSPARPCVCAPGTDFRAGLGVC